MKAWWSGVFIIAFSAAALAQSAEPAQHTAKSSGTMHRARKAAGPSLAEQMKELREQLATQQQQIQQLQNQLASRDQQIQLALQAANEANSRASAADQKATDAQSSSSDAKTQVEALNTSVSDVKSSNQTLATTVENAQKQVAATTQEPTSIRFKGITISPTGSFIAAETIWRQRGMGADIDTQFTGIPFSGASNAHLSEFNATGRQSRLALLGEGKIGSYIARAYYEADWLSAGTTSNDNQSNSYTMRQRQLFGQIATDSGWTFTGGQMWSLATETLHGLDNRTEALPQTIDPQYHVGFTWERQYGARLVKSFDKKLWLGAALEEPQTLNVGGGGIAGTIVFQQTGNLAGVYNNQANYSYNLAPDVIGKVAFEPGWGHYELFGIARFFRDRVYPNATGTSNSAVGAFNDTRTGGGLGANLRVPVIAKKLDFAFHILAGDGVGRYGDSTLADVTLRPDGTFAPIRGGSSLTSLEFHATPRLDLVAYYGIDYDQRQIYDLGGGKFVGYGRPTLATTGCNVEVAPAAAAGNSVLSSSTSTPSSCSPDIRDMQEATLGYWFDIYRGSRGRLRQAVQYSHFMKDTWRGTGGSPQANDNMVWTSFRYYLP